MENYCTVTGQTVIIWIGMGMNGGFLFKVRFAMHQALRYERVPDATCLADKLTQMLQISICAIQQ